MKSGIPRHSLSKSTFMRGSQCAKSLWMHKFEPQNKDERDESKEILFAQGTNVGLLARELFPGGTDASPATPFLYQQSVLETSGLIAGGTKVIYEAAFQYDKVLAAMDILVEKKNKWFAFEVKSSTSIKEQFIQDAAFQYYVITNSGVVLDDIFIIYINNQYIRKGEINIKELFTIESVLARVLALQPVIVKKIEELKTIINLKEKPVTDIGAHCHSPYTCDFHGHCWNHIPENSVFNLRGNGGFNRALELYQQGIIKMSEIPVDFVLSKDQQKQMETEVSTNPIIEKKEIRLFLDGLIYPLYFLDFETFSIPLPPYDGCKPYQQIPFQFSLHIQHFPDGAVEHKDFLAEAGKDPRKEFLYFLTEYLGTSGTVLVYNQAFEKMILNNLSELFPTQGASIDAIRKRIIDLMIPFRKKHYYLAGMDGSHSIKKVLPALVPELNYKNLAINNGAAASQTYYNLKFQKSPAMTNLIRKQLKEYCCLDTLAMVKLLEKLKQVGEI